LFHSILLTNSFFISFHLLSLFFNSEDFCIYQLLSNQSINGFSGANNKFLSITDSFFSVFPKISQTFLVVSLTIGSADSGASISFVGFSEVFSSLCFGFFDSFSTHFSFFI